MFDFEDFVYFVVFEEGDCLVVCVCEWVVWIVGGFCFRYWC